jgi:hypothetical protein
MPTHVVLALRLFYRTAVPAVARARFCRFLSGFRKPSSRPSRYTRFLLIFIPSLLRASSSADGPIPDVSSPARAITSKSVALRSRCALHTAVSMVTASLRRRFVLRPSQRTPLPPSLPTGRSPFPRSDITTVVTIANPPMASHPCPMITPPKAGETTASHWNVS